MSDQPIGERVAVLEAANEVAEGQRGEMIDALKTVNTTLGAVVSSNAVILEKMTTGSSRMDGQDKKIDAATLRIAALEKAGWTREVQLKTARGLARILWVGLGSLGTVAILVVTKGADVWHAIAATMAAK